MKIVRLTPEQVEHADRVAELRHRAACSAGRLDRHGLDPARGAGAHLLGARGECAAALALGLAWTPTVNTYRAEGGDGIGLGREVRTRSRSWYALVVRPGDADHLRFVHVTALDLQQTIFGVWGWITARDAKQECWYRSYGGRAPQYYVPAHALIPIG